MFQKKTVEDVEVGGKRVLVRVDFNLPLDPHTGLPTSDSRIKATLPTLEYLISKRAKIILCSHLGRPKGQVVEELKMAKVAPLLSRLLRRKILLASDCVGGEVRQLAESMSEGDILLLENLRFHPEEERNDIQFAQELSRLADVFVDDAFGVSHRSHASVVGVPAFLPAVAGFLIRKEVSFITGALEDPSHPLALLSGGAKVKDKIGVLENALDKVDLLLLGGGMAQTFLYYQGYKVGKSEIEKDKADFVAGIMRKMQSKGIKLLLPQDVVITKDIRNPDSAQVTEISSVPSDFIIVDIGPATVNKFSEELQRCHTVLWNGPMGVYEITHFASGTHAMARFLSQIPATTIIGGGSTAEVVEELGLSDKMTWVSTGGGASLMLLEGKKLPGVEILLDK
jgi:phosphoglycerate kinase